MGTVRQLAIEIEAGLRAAHPTSRKTVVTKLALAVGAILEAQTPNTAALANLLPLETERQDMRDMALAMYWCVRVGQEDARDHSTPLEKNSSANRSRSLDL